MNKLPHDLGLLRDYAAALMAAKQNLIDAEGEIAQLKREVAALRRIIDELDRERLTSDWWAGRTAFDNHD